MTIFRLIDFATPVPAALDATTAVAASSVLTLCYVGGLYVSTATRIGQARSKEGILLTKDDATVVRSRLRAACSTGTAALLATVAVVKQKAYGNQHALFGTLAALRVVGLPLPVPSVLHGNVLPFQPSLTLFTLHHFLPTSIVPLILTSALFFGPLVAEALDGTLIGQRHSPSLRAVLREKFANVWGVRNFILGPITEEVVFRGCIVALHALAGFNKTFLLFATPLYFGIAHLHHAYEGYVNEGRTRDALVRSSIRSFVQFTYTTLFGWYANFLFMRTNTLRAPIVAHIFCNIMGLPNPINDARRHPKRKWLIYISYALGMATFAYSLMPLTKPGLFGGSWYWS